jgi:quercetin dioxygenase-like cupin family protein
MPDFVMQRWALTPVPYPQAPLHIHDGGDEGFVVLDGKLDVTLGTEVRRLHAGEFVVVTAGTPHTFATVDDTPASVLVTMSPQIDALVRELHEVPEAERPAVWARYNSRLA